MISYDHLFRYSDKCSIIRTDIMKTLSIAGAFSLLAVACLTIMVGCVIVPGLPAVAHALGVGKAASWLVTVPALGVILFGPLAGRLIDRLGLYHALCMGLFMYGLLGFIGVVLKGPWLVFADRLALGGATAVIMAAGTGLISVFYQGQARLSMIARQGMSIELGGVIFLFLGGLLASIGWQWPFVLYLSAWLMLLMVLAFVPRPAPIALHEGKMPEKGVLCTSLKVVFCAALLSMVVFFAGVILLPLRLHKMGFNEAETGYLLAYVSLVAVGAAALMPRAARQLSEYGTLITAFIFYALAHLAFAVADALPLLLEGGLCLGIGFGLSIPLVNHMTLEQSHALQRGRNLAYLSMAIFGGQFLSSFMQLIPGEYPRAFIAAAVIALATAISMALIQRRLRTAHKPVGD